MIRYISHLWDSRRHAWHGVVYTFRHEPNFRIQCGVALVVIAFMSVVRLSELEVIIILLLIMAVLVLELLNTAIESLTDVVKPRLHQQVGLIKDVTAGMVLLVSMTAAVVGAIIFYPHVF